MTTYRSLLRSEMIAEAQAEERRRQREADAERVRANDPNLSANGMGAGSWWAEWFDEDAFYGEGDYA